MAGIGASKDPDIYVVFISFINIKTTSLKAFSLSASSANSLGSIFKMTWVVTKLDSLKTLSKHPLATTKRAAFSKPDLLLTR